MRLKTIGSSLMLLALASLLGGCPGDNENFVPEAYPVIRVAYEGVELSHGDTILVNAAVLAPGQQGAVARIQVSNIGTLGPLDVTDIAIESTPAGVLGLEPMPPMAALPTTGAPWVLDTPEDGGGYGEVALTFTRGLTDEPVSATLTVSSNSVDEGTSELSFPVQVQLAAPTIHAPALLDFGNVSQGESESTELRVLNIGNGPLTVDRVHLEGAQFTLIDGQGKWQGSPATAQDGIEFVNPIVIPAGETHTFFVEFTPDSPDPTYGQLRLMSDDPDPEKLQQGAIVKLQGNVGGPCIALNPVKVDFGGKLLGQVGIVEVQVLSCGDAPAEIRELRLPTQAELDAEGLSGDFSLDLTGLPGVPDGATELTPDDAPVPIPINGFVTFEVKYTPDEINPKDPAGKPVPDISYILVRSNTYVAEIEAEVRGFAVDEICPVAVIKVVEGEEVIPQTTLHLVGSQSYSSTGIVAAYEWTVEQPPGSQSVFLPSASVPDPTFEVNAAGTYIFKLDVWDDLGKVSCYTDEYQVVVVPEQAIHVELLWHTPADLDETDEGPEAGADLDLHFVHPFASGIDGDLDGKPDGYFDNPFDCFWFNPNPDWGSHDSMVDDDPSLDRDDTDGAGPENINLSMPEDGIEYRVGVHYWNDHSFGPSLATVRIYIHGVLVFQLDELEMIHHDMCEIADIAWPSGQVTPILGPGGGPKCIGDYQHPLFMNP